MVLQATNIHKSYGALEILKGVHVNIQRGEIVSIVGRSGAGKSTLLHILGTLDAADQGDLAIADIAIKSLKAKQLAQFRNQHIGFVFQSFQLLAPLTALENVMLPLELAGHTNPKQVAKDMLARVGLAERLNHYPKVMSGGEQQRVALARAFVVKPDVLLADEPTGSLDHATGEKVMQLMLELNKELGTTLVMVTHDRTLSERCDQRLVMEAGRATLQA